MSQKNDEDLARVDSLCSDDRSELPQQATVVSEQSLPEARITRLRVLLRFFEQPVDLAVVKDASDGQTAWVAMSRQMYQAAQGTTEEQAITAWRRSFAATLLTLGDHRYAMHDDCPDDVWKEFTEQSGAHRYSVLAFDTNVGRPTLTEE